MVNAVTQRTTVAAMQPDRPRDDSRAPGVRIEVVGVDRHAGDHPILHGVTLTFEPGELV